MAPTEIHQKIPITNTGKVKLELVPPGISIPIKESIVMSPGVYRVVAFPGGPAVVIAEISYAIGGFKVTPTANSVPDARFAVYVNLLEH